MTAPDDELFAELAYLGRHVHWSLDALLDLQHAVRRRFLAELARDDEQ